MRLRLRIAPDRRCVCTRFVLALICVGASFLSAANPHGAAPLFLHGLLNPIGPRFVSRHRRTPAKRPRLGSATLNPSPQRRKLRQTVPSLLVSGSVARPSPHAFPNLPCAPYARVFAFRCRQGACRFAATRTATP